MKNPRTPAYVAGAIAAVFALIAIFSHGTLGIVFEILAIITWLGIGIGVAAREKQDRSPQEP